jgi:hypothetical protein
MSKAKWRHTVLTATVAVLLAGAPGAVFGQGKRPPAAALIAAAKATPLKNFEVMEELRGLTVEDWMRKLFGATPVAWRAATCGPKAGKPVAATIPICVEATVRLKAGVIFTLGVGFDDQVPRPERKPNAIWGSVSAGGKPCAFYRHPDQVQLGRPKLDEMVKAGGRCP